MRQDTVSGPLSSTLKMAQKGLETTIDEEANKRATQAVALTEAERRAQYEAEKAQMLAQREQELRNNAMRQALAPQGIVDRESAGEPVVSPTDVIVQGEQVVADGARAIDPRELDDIVGELDMAAQQGASPEEIAQYINSLPENIQAALAQIQADRRGNAGQNMSAMAMNGAVSPQGIQGGQSGNPLTAAAQSVVGEMLNPQDPQGQVG